MPSIHYLNPGPHPFWEFVAGLEDHPFFATYGQPQRPAFGENVDSNEGARQADAGEAKSAPGEKSADKQPTVEDPPEVDPSTLRSGEAEAPDARGCPSHGGRGGPAPPFDPFEGGIGRRGHPGCRGRGGRHGMHGPPPFAFGFGGAHPWARGPHPGPHAGPDHPPHHGPPRGPHHGPRFGHHHGPHHGPGPHDHHGYQRGARGHSPEHRRPPFGARGFDLGQFLNKLGDKLGIDLVSAAENVGVGSFWGPQNSPEVDFEPRADIFDTPTNYIVHLSLPGAKKDDVGVDWDGENSVLRIAGVVHRPGVDEEMLSQLVVNGRKRENGVFEKAVRLGTKHEPASIDVSDIHAKMTDGILVITVPKVKVEHRKREIPITSSATPSPPRRPNNEKDLLSDPDHEMYDAPVHLTKQAEEEAVVTETASTKEKSMDLDNFTEKPNEKVAEAHAEAEDDRSQTVGREEHLPQYTVEDHQNESDWEKDSDEGEYVKINVE